MPTQADLNEDWIKTSRRAWDVRRPDHSPVTEVAHLRDELGWDDDQIDHFLDLPAALGAPDSLLRGLADEGKERAAEILDERAARGQTDEDPETWR